MIPGQTQAASIWPDRSADAECYRRARPLHQLLTLRWPRAAALVFCGLVGVLAPAAYGTVVGTPSPVYHDEFSYLLGADTFARGRLTNPAPPLPEFFEAPHVLVVPHYSSKYPPAQSLALALGQVVSGRPIWGVWLTCGLFAASLCWMLQAWTTRQWALAIAILAIVTIGTSTYWAQSYWGGMVAASGGALLFGGMRRTLRLPRLSSSLLMAAGILLLANSRPFEGMLVCIPAAVLLGRWLFRENRVSLRTKVNAFVLPVIAVLAAGAMWMAYYNRAVTGDWRRTPYDLHLSQYFHHGVFLFSQLREPERTPPDRVSRFYQEDESTPLHGLALVSAGATNFALRMLSSLATPFGVLPGHNLPKYNGVLLWVALLIAFSRYRSTTGVAVAAAVGAAVESVLSWTVVPVYVGTLTVLAVAPWVISFDATYRRNRWSRFMIATLVTVVLGQALVWWWSPHYSAPLVPLLLAVIATTIQRVGRRSRGGSIRLRLGGILLVLLTVQFATLAALHIFRLDPNVATGGGARSEVLSRLEQQGGSHIVFVRYDGDFIAHYEWVYNPADLDSSLVIFAHDLGPGRNSALLAAYPGRSPWVVTVSDGQARLDAYPSISHAEHKQSGR